MPGPTSKLRKIYQQSQSHEQFCWTQLKGSKDDETEKNLKYEQMDVHVFAVSVFAMDFYISPKITTL